MASEIPDFRTRTPSIDPMAFANVLQRKAQMEQEQKNTDRARKDAQIKGLMDAVVTGQTIASNMMTLAEKRGQRQATEDISGILQEPSADPILAPTREKRLLDALSRRSPDTFDKALLAKEFATKTVKEPNLQSKSIMLDGKPTEALFNPNPADGEASYLDAHTRQPLAGKIEPYNANVQTDLTDEDRKRLSPLAKAVVEGRATPSALVNARGQDKEKLSRIAAEIDPQFDLSLAPQRIQIRKDYSPAGKSGQNITSQNTVIGHLDSLYEASKKLDNLNIPKGNTIINYAKNNLGKPEVKQFNAALMAVTSEMAKSFQGSGIVTNDERAEFRQQISDASSPAQVKAVTETWIDLIKSRNDAVKAGWEQTMSGVKPPTPFINDKAREKLIKHGYDPETLEKKESQQGTQQIDAIASFLKLPKKK